MATEMVERHSLWLTDKKDMEEAGVRTVKGHRKPRHNSQVLVNTAQARPPSACTEGGSRGRAALEAEKEPAPSSRLPILLHKTPLFEGSVPPFHGKVNAPAHTFPSHNAPFQNETELDRSLRIFICHSVTVHSTWGANST